jgi:hypothetical protein
MHRWRSEDERSSSGLSLLELATVLALTGLLAFGGHIAAFEARKNACRARARAALDNVYRSQVLYSAVHGKYTDMFAALHSMGLPAQLDPLYRFALDVPAPSSFHCEGWANLDSDTDVDSLFVDESGIIRSLTKD